MTERLRDLVDADDPALAELALLVRAASDLDPAPGAQDRVRHALAGSRRRRSWFGRPVLVVLVLVAVTPVVVAGVWRFVASPTGSVQIAPAERDRTTPPRPPPATSRHAVPSSVPPAGEPVVTGPDPTLDPTLDPAPGLDPAVRPSSPTVPSLDDSAPAAPSRRPIRPRTTTPTPGLPPTPPTPSSLISRSPASPADPAPPPATVPASEAALVLRALHLLRFDHDAPGALRELDSYRARFPDGDLAEEALALAIEAHASLNDDAARALAEQYLQQFSRGRFRALAERMVRESP